MKKYMQPTATVIECAPESALLNASLNINDQIGDEEEYTNKKGGWSSDLWTDTEE